jgi:hypothetical protein
MLSQAIANAEAVDVTGSFLPALPQHAAHSKDPKWIIPEAVSGCPCSSQRANVFKWLQLGSQ